MQEVREELWRGAEGGGGGRRRKGGGGRAGRGPESPRPGAFPATSPSRVAAPCPAGRPTAVQPRMRESRRERSTERLVKQKHIFSGRTVCAVCSWQCLGWGPGGRRPARPAAHGPRSLSVPRHQSRAFHKRIKTAHPEPRDWIGN